LQTLARSSRSSGCAIIVGDASPKTRTTPSTSTALYQILADPGSKEIVFKTTDASPPPPPLLDAVVCGGGPAGLLSAIMLARTFDYRVKVYERLPAPPSPTDESVWGDVAKFYLIGLGERGQAALKEFGVWDDVEACCTAVPGRMDWAPDAGPDEGVERIFADRPVMTQVLPRDKLVGVLHQHILRNYRGKIDLEYQREVTPIDFDNDGGSSVLIGVSNCDSAFLRETPSNVGMQSMSEESLCDVDKFELVRAKVLIAADGTQRNIANEMVKADKEKRASMSLLEKVRYGPSFHIKRYVDDNQRVYKTIPMKVPSKWRNDLNYSARSKDGRVFFDSLPADAHGNQCAVLLLKRDDELAQENSDPKELRALFDEALPQFSALLDDEVIEAVARKSPSFLPSFRYAAPRLNQGDRTVILGDAIHTVKPYFGLGANSALEDVQVSHHEYADHHQFIVCSHASTILFSVVTPSTQILKRSIESTTSIKEATHLFSKDRAEESKALVQISRKLDRPGLLGVFTFILPLVVDSIFHKLAPWLFSPNTIAMLQKSENTFCGLRRRKRLERVGQLATLGSFVAVLTIGARQLIRTMSRVTGKRGTTVTIALLGAAAVIAFAKKLAVFLVPGLAPADVLNKASRRKENDLHVIEAYEIDVEDIASNMAGGGI
jgi:2-polyprenyl-6-methoxyphenol hydroxylase-like FAD-dependent oxidoreductase